MIHSENRKDQAGRGRLKIFLGYASGVGKSFRMFDEGRRRRDRGQDVVVGALQPEVPDDVKPLLASLEVVPTIDVEGVPVIDVPAIIRRNPQICLIDGLAYDNPPQSRNFYRFQDVEELLIDGINVIGSVNLQHIDDQREAIEKITGKQVSQTVPRTFLNTADEIVVIDSPCPIASKQTVELREMALLLSADVIDAGLKRYLKAHHIEPDWAANERLLVYLNPGSEADGIIANARRSSNRFHCDLLTVCAVNEKLSHKERKQQSETVAKLQAQGIRVDSLEGEDPVESVVEYARSHGVTQIFIGNGGKRTLMTRLFGTPASRLVRAARGIDVRVIPSLA